MCWKILFLSVAYLKQCDEEIERQANVRGCARRDFPYANTCQIMVAYFRLQHFFQFLVLDAFTFQFGTSSNASCLQCDKRVVLQFCASGPEVARKWLTVFHSSKYLCILFYIISIFKHFPIPAASRHLPFSQPRVERGEKVEVQSKKFLSAFLKTPNFKTTCSMHI